MGQSLPKPILGDRFVDAVCYAVELHANQARKSTTIPYVTHLFAVCSLVLEDGGTEDEAIAALLHDGPEDRGGHAVLDEISRRFGDDVARLVDALSDTLLEPKPEWRPRKEGYLARLGNEPESVLRISLADKLHNARSILVDHLAAGDDEPVWTRFSAGEGEQAWYFRELLALFEARLPASRNLPEFRRVLETLFPGSPASSAH